MRRSGFADSLWVRAEERGQAAAVAMGKVAADRAIVNARVVLVQSGEILRAHIALAGRLVAYVGPEEFWRGPDTTIVDADGAYAVPGYVEPHAHPFMVYNPDSLARFFLTRGITTAVGDLLNIQQSLPPDAWLRYLEEYRRSPFLWLWAPRLVGQGRPLGHGDPAELEELLSHPRVVQTAEWTDWPALMSDAGGRWTSQLAALRERGLRIDGHTAGARDAYVQALTVCGISACHEAIDVDQALSRLRSGLYVILRHSSLRPDLPQWIRWLTSTESLNLSHVMLTHDGANPAWLAQEGAIDQVVADLIAAGMPAERAVSLATLNPARYYGLDDVIGQIAPGRLANLQLRQEWHGIPQQVWQAGALVAEGGALLVDWSPPQWSGYAFHVLPPWHRELGRPDTYRRAVTPEHPVGRFVNAAIVRPDDAGGLPDGEAVRAVLISQDARSVTGMWLRDFAPHLDGLATTFVESGSVLVVGRHPKAMAAAADQLWQMGGGVVVVESGHVVVRLPCTIDGKMSAAPMSTAASATATLYRYLEARGYRWGDALYSLDFLTCNFLPTLRLLQEGVYDVQQRRVVSAPMPVAP
jgi:adenine deaminase